MRVIGDQFAHIDDKATGERLHTKVRMLRDDQGRVAVFLSPSAGPAHVYDLDDVTVTRTSANCSHPVCHGKATRMKLARLWETAETANAV